MYIFLDLSNLLLLVPYYPYVSSSQLASALAYVSLQVRFLQVNSTVWCPMSRLLGAIELDVDDVGL